MNGACIVWFRQDLRLEDNPALRAAVERGGPVIAVYIWDPEEDGKWAPGAASRMWLGHSLRSLDRHLQKNASRLHLLRGPSLETLHQLANETGADTVFWNRCYEPHAIARDRKIEESLKEAGLTVKSFNASLLFEPWEIQTKSGGPYKVFTPFWKACLRKGVQRDPLPAPGKIPSLSRKIQLQELDVLQLQLNQNSIPELRWNPGTESAHQLLSDFLDRTVAEYPDLRDRPDLDGTSRLSPHLHFGEISPHQIWHETRIRLTAQKGKSMQAGAEAFLRQIVWREFAFHLLFHFPETADCPLRPEFKKFPWRRNKKQLQAWRDGQTGYPFIDAGMRELLNTGTMHNRVRMAAASFLVKDLTIPWQEGAAWFWQRLADADLANNTLGWQWTAGCGADAAPFFRIFNPITQGEKFDPKGMYTRRWVPEIARAAGSLAAKTMGCARERSG